LKQNKSSSQHNDQSSRTGSGTTALIRSKAHKLLHFDDRVRKECRAPRSQEIEYEVSFAKTILTRVGQAFLARSLSAINGLKRLTCARFAIIGRWLTNCYTVLVRTAISDDEQGTVTMRAVSNHFHSILAGSLVLVAVSSTYAAVNRIEPDDYAEDAVLNDVHSLVDLRIYDGTLRTFPADFGVFPDPTVIPVTANENADIFGGYFTSTGTKTFGHGGITFFSESRQLGMQFLTTTSQVTIDFIGTNSLASEIGVLQVYDGQGTLLNTFTSAPLFAHQVATLSITRPLGDIGYARAYSSPTADPFGTLDNLRFVTALAGDFNTDNVVDARDYVVWRKGMGTTFNQTDYQQWRGKFGSAGGAGTGLDDVSSVPEPSGLSLLFLSLVSAATFKRRR
jgi:hypothetical protein